MGEAQILYVLDASAYSFKLTAIRRQRSYVREQKAGHGIMFIGFRDNPSASCHLVGEMD